jgi:kynurenine formamidase
MIVSFRKHRSTRGLTLMVVLALAAAGVTNAKPLTLEDVIAGRAQIFDLSYPLNSKSAFWPGDKYSPFKLETIATIEQDGVLSKAFSSPEHLGTHIDAPNHFAKNQISVDQIKPEALFGPGVVIDVAARASDNADFLLTAEHVKAWETKHGQIPDGAIVLLNTGWHRHWGNAARYQNKDPRGQMHFPGFGADAAKLLVEERRVRGIGIDTMSMDYGLSRDFAVHKIVNGAGRYGLENVANLDKLPMRGFHLFIAPMKIETGTGGPTRIFAFIPK